jgi:glycosyl transferase family 1
MPDGLDDHTARRPLALGVNLAGYFGATLGLGEAVRHVAGALEAAGVAVARVDLRHASAPDHEATAPAAAGDAGAPYPATIVCANPDGMAGARADRPDAFADRRVIGLWWWEVMAFPSRWLRAFDAVDEVWVGSRFVADALAAVAPVPVVALPMPVVPPAPAAVDRAALGLPDGFLFGFVFDYGSVAARKNPVGLVQAFLRAFPDDTGERLVLKALGADRHPAEHAALLEAAGGDPRIRVIDRHLAKPENDALIAALDCYVSLHRSEGFGLTIAEAMLLGTPVITTAYGGPMDFATPFNAALVDHRLVAIGPGHDPYPADGEWADPDLDHAAAQMRAVRADPEAARVRAARARDDVERRHAPAAAGRVMADRLAHALQVPRGAGTRVDALDLAPAERRVRSGAGGAAPGTTRARGALRDTVLRVLKPYTVHQRLVDEEVLGLIRTLDERVRGIATAQSTLAAEIARLRARVDGGAGDGAPPDPPGPTGDRVPPSNAS